MANNLTKEQYAVEFNAGAAYAKAHAETNPNEVIGGMRYLFKQSQHLSEEPIIQRVLAESKAYLGVNNDYFNKVREWENKPKETRGEKPKFVQPEGYMEAAHSYDQLTNSSEVRTGILATNYGKLTVQQGIGVTLGGQMPDSTPAKVKTAIARNTKGLIEQIRSPTLKDTMAAIMGFYINGQTARNIQKMYLEENLEAIAQRAT